MKTKISESGRSHFGNRTDAPQLAEAVMSQFDAAWGGVGHALAGISCCMLQNPTFLRGASSSIVSS